jgi:hypothetical protein
MNIDQYVKSLRITDILNPDIKKYDAIKFMTCDPNEADIVQLKEYDDNSSIIINEHTLKKELMKCTIPIMNLKSIKSINCMFIGYKLIDKSAIKNEMLINDLGLVFHKGGQITSI